MTGISKFRYIPENPLLNRAKPLGNLLLDFYTFFRIFVIFLFLLGQRIFYHFAQLGI